MNKELMIRGMLVVLVLFLIAFFFFGNKNLFSMKQQPAYVQEIVGPSSEELANCPTNFTVGYYVEANNSPYILEDGHVFISIRNGESKDYLFEVSLNNQSEGSIFVPAKGRNFTHSQLLTAWWQGITENSTSFDLFLAVQGCDPKVISPNFNLDQRNLVAFSASGGGGMRYAVQIIKQKPYLE